MRVAHIEWTIRHIAWRNESTHLAHLWGLYTKSREAQPDGLSITPCQYFLHVISLPIPYGTAMDHTSQSGHKSQNQPLTDTARTSMRCSPLSTHAPVMPHPLVAFPNATASLFGAMLTPLCMHLWRSEPLALCARCVLHTHPVYSCRRCCADVQRHTGRSSLLELPTALITKLPC